MKLFIGIPNTGSIRTELVEWLFLQKFEKILFSIDGFKDTNANKIIASFLLSECDHLLLLDSDLLPDLEMINRLESYKKDIVSGIPLIFNMHEKKFKIAAFKKKENSWYHLGNTGKLENVDVIGGACILIKRKVLEKIPTPWFKMVMADNGTDRKGADIYFSEKAIKNGFELYADCTTVIGHKNCVDLKDILAFTENQKKKD